jgi:hypothetical protein
VVLHSAGIVAKHLIGFRIAGQRGKTLQASTIIFKHHDRKVHPKAGEQWHLLSGLQPGLERESAKLTPIHIGKRANSAIAEVVLRLGDREAQVMVKH